MYEYVTQLGISIWLLIYTNINKVKSIEEIVQQLLVTATSKLCIYTETQLRKESNINNYTLQLLGLLQLASSDRVETYKDKLEEATTQFTSWKKKLVEHREAQHLRSVLMDRHALTSSPIHKKKKQSQASVSEFGVERSSNGADDVPLQKPSSDKRKLIQKKQTSVKFIKKVKPFPRLKPRQFLIHV